MLKLAVRNLLRQKARTALTLIVVTFGVAALILSGGFVEDVFFQLREATIHSRLGHIQAQKSGYSEIGRRSPYKFLLKEPEQLVARLRGLTHVKEVMQRVEFSGLITTGRGDRPIVGEGIEPGKEARLGTFLEIASGRQLTDSDRFGALLGQGVADALGAAPSDFVNLMVNTPDGALNVLEFEVIGVFRTFSKDYDDRAVRISLEAAQELLATEGAHSLVFALDRTEFTDSVARRVEEALSGESMEVRTWLELADFYRKTVELYKRQFGVLQLIILVMVILSVSISVNMVIFERVGEFGTQMALGNRGTDIFRLILKENSLLSLFGAAAGVALGSALAWVISQVGIPMPPPPNSNAGYIAYIRLVPSVVAMAFAIGFVATVLAAILPARRASRLPVAEALKQNV